MNHLLRNLTKGVDKPVQAVVNGTIPKWIKGSLYRNGPGQYEVGDKAYKHLFDGFACMHKFTIHEGKVTYFNKFLETESYKRSNAEKRLYPVFGTSDVCSNIFGRLQTMFKWPETFDNTNVTVLPYGQDQLYALTETHLMCKIDPRDLSVLERIDITKVIPSASSTIAHAHADQQGGGGGGGGWITYGMNLRNKQQPRYEFIRYKGGNAQNATLDNQVIASIPTSHGNGLSYCHSFGLSDNYIVFLEQSMIFDLKAYIVGLVKNRPFSDALKTKKDLRTRIHVINRQTGQVVAQKFTTDPLVVFHHINAYETANSAGEKTIVVDLCAYDAESFDIDALSYEGMFSEKMIGQKTFNSPPSRIEIPVDKTGEQEIFCKLRPLNPDVSIELPVINYGKYNGKKYQFMYGVNYYKSPFSIVKVDAENPEAVLEKKYSKELPSEPIFVASPEAKSEDDGVLLVMVLSDKNDSLSVLDAKSMTEIARAELPEEAKASFTFHGIFDKRQVSQAPQGA